MIYNEQDYLYALSKINDIDYDDNKWLIDNFELYKSTLNWPVGLPPINRTNLIEGTLKKKFNLFYYDLLKDFNFKFDNDNLKIIIKKDK